jgi:hypothetical protein
MIRRLVQLVLDQAKAREVEREVGRALDRGTDARKPKQNLTLIERALGGLKRAAIALGGVLAVTFGVRAITRFGKEVVRVAIEAAGIWNRLAGQLGAVGVAFEDVEAEIASTARAMQDATTVGDEQFAQVLTELVGITQDYTASLADVQTVADLAAAKQIDLMTAAKLVGRAMVGETGTLSRYGIIVAEGADAMEVLRDRFRGMAENEGRTLQGRVAMLNNEWADFKQAVGDAMIEAGGGTSALDTLIGTVKGLTTWINGNRSAIANWGRIVIRTVQAVGESFRFIARIVGNTFDVVGTTVAKTLLAMRQDFEVSTNRFIELLNQIPGVDIEFRMNAMTPEEYAAAQHALTEEIEKDTLDMQDAVLDLADAYKQVGVAAVAAATGQAAVGGAPRGRGVVAAPGAPPIDADAAKKAWEEQLRMWDAEAEAMAATREHQNAEIEAAAALSKRRLDVLAAANEAARKFREEELEALREKTAEVAESMADSFRGFFEAMALGFQGQGDIFATAVQAAREAGASIVGALVAGRAEEQMAAGTAALASGLWPPNPAAWGAALKHFAAAALYRAIPGVVRGGGGFGGGGASLPRGALGTSVPGSRDVQGAEVHIYLDQLSPADPRFQRVVMGATQNAVERFGQNVKVNVHPRSSG